MIPFSHPAAAGDPFGRKHVFKLDPESKADPWTAAAAPTTSAVTPADGAPRLPPVSLPADEQPHRAGTEWWYFVVHLEVEGGRRLSLVFIVLKEEAPLRPAAVLGVVHHVDHDLGMNPPVVNAQLLSTTFTQLPPPQCYRFDFSTWRGPFSHVSSWTLEGGDGYYTIRMEHPYRLELRISPGMVGGRRSKPVTLGDRGVVDLGHGRELAYYLWTGLRVEGQLETDAGVKPVKGTGWLDRQWGHPPVRAMYWKYLAVDLAERDEQWMFFHLIHTDLPDEPAKTFGVRVDAHSQVTQFDDVQIVDSRQVGSYRIDSTVTVAEADLELEITPLFEEQEIVPRGLLRLPLPTAPRWFEGVSTVEGTIGGAAVQGVAMTEIYSPDAQ